MPCRHRREVVNISSRCERCASLMLEHADLGRRVELLERQLRAADNIQALLVAKDRELAACRARLEQLGVPTTTTTMTTWHKPSMQA